jgi:hypothetical protein
MIPVNSRREDIHIFEFEQDEAELGSEFSISSLLQKFKL